MNNSSSQANSRIAKNTLFLYLRKILGLAIALYTSRVLLQTLGVDDFGLYGLVGSIVLLFNSLRSLFASSIQRFLNTEKNSTVAIQNRIFSMGVSIHVGIAIVFFIIVEIAGVIMIPYLDLLPEKASDAFWVLQFSIFSAIVAILTVPYDALLMAKERFDVVAGFSLLDSVLRLGIIYLLVISPINRVISYSILLFFVGLFIRMLNAYYCKLKFKEITKYKFIKDKILIKKMTQFAGWNFLGNLGYSLTNQGLNFILNLFGGVLANAARAIAYQVNDNMRSFVIDISLAFSPQSMMSFKDDKTRFYNLQFFSSKASTGIFLILVMPMYLMTEPILMLWLGECPLYAVSFIHGIIFYSIVRNCHGPVDIAFKSANQMKTYQIVEITTMSLNLPISWVILHFGAPLYSVFIVMTCIELVNLVAILAIAYSRLCFPVWNFLKRVILPSVSACLILAVSIYIFIYLNIEADSIIKLLIYCALSMVFAAIVILFVIFDGNERKKIIKIFKKQ